MSELRHDKANDIQTIVAPVRGRRPHDGNAPREDRDSLPGYDPECPFCPGNEAMLPKILHERASDDPPGWLTRVVPNRYPAVEPDATANTQDLALYAATGGYGHHEVIIESPRHDADPAGMSEAEFRTVIAACRERYGELSRRPGIRSVTLFRNHGAAAGASLRHPHSQIIALAVEPPLMRSRDRTAQRFWRETGRCPICEVMTAEREDGRRVVLETEAFLAIVPYAALVPFEVWIIPRTHRADFGGVTTAECAAFAAILRRVLIRIRNALDDPPYNYVINTTPGNGSGRPHLHWHLRLTPDPDPLAGFELGSGLSINPSLPEEDAATLRATAEHS